MVLLPLKCTTLFDLIDDVRFNRGRNLRIYQADTTTITV